METVRTLNDISVDHKYDLIRKQFAVISFVILSVRGYFGSFGYDTLGITILLNIFLIASIDYRHVNRLFLLVPFLVISMFNNKTVLGIIDLFAMCLVLRNVRLSKLASIYFTVLIIFIPIWLFLLREGYIISKRWFDPAKGGEFWDYGFANPNGLGIFGFQLCATLYILLYKKHIIISILATLAISQLFYSLSFCRTAWLGGMVLAFCSLSLYLKLYRNWMKYPLSVFPIFLFFVIIFLAKKVSSYEVLDILFSGRLSIWSSIINTMGPLNWLFGASQSDLTIDGSFAMLLFLGGLILVAVFCYLFYEMTIKYYKKIIPYLPFILAVMACGVMETTFSACGGFSVIFWYILFNPEKIPVDY